MNAIHQSKAFTLVEVMVSIVLLTISMVGLAALQNSSTRYDHQAYLRSQSIIQGTDMVDRMRANNAGVVGGFYIADPVPTTFTKDCGISTSTCTARELAVYDIVKWNTDNVARLPAGASSITSLGDSVFQVTVMWQEQKNERLVGGAYVNPCDGSNNENLHCYRLVVRL